MIPQEDINAIRSTLHLTFSNLSDVVFTGSVGGIEKLDRRASNTLTQDAIETKCNVAREHRVRLFES